MMQKAFWSLVIMTVSFYAFSSGSDEEDKYPPLNGNNTYCFEYTWLGPEYDNSTQMNSTCEEYKDDYRTGDKIPCSSPLVISIDGTIPDKEWLWTNHQNSVACRKAENQECVTYTFWENGLVTNQTHMCARVRSSSKTTPYGCFKQNVDGGEVELCICKATSGLGMPCNSNAVRRNVVFGVIAVSLSINFLYSHF
ncbi:uncharacterized protein [Euwallacea fornicatus]|uniref:uncharacterized protein n=1 Tax=Euwallacea fornicatus TaxID=995702 RepID=UPI00338F2FF7